MRGLRGRDKGVMKIQMNKKRRMAAAIMSILTVYGSLAGCGAFPGAGEQKAENLSEYYETRVDFGAKFEPKGNYILHGAGQDQSGITVTFDNYVNVMGQDSIPVITMGYAAPHHNYVDWASYMKKGIEAYGEENYLFLQVGVHFNKDENPDECYYDEIADGNMDRELKSLIQTLKSFRRPVFCRPGFEFNGQWNGYKDGEIYKRAYIRFAELTRECEADNIALLWCYNPDAAEKDYMKYYPGDEYVDWWAIDIFRIASTDLAETKAFLNDADFHEKPVMITEATPYGCDVTKGEGWEEWFEPYFRFVRENPVIKATCYINWKWYDYPQWSNWGDARLEEAPEDLVEKYRRELSDPVYLHAGEKEDMIASLYDCGDYGK